MPEAENKSHELNTELNDNTLQALADLARAANLLHHLVTPGGKFDEATKLVMAHAGIAQSLRDTLAAHMALLASLTNNDVDTEGTFKTPFAAHEWIVKGHRLPEYKHPMD